MSKDTVLAMARALPGVKEDGGALLFDESSDVTLHLARGAAVIAIQQITKVTLHEAFLVADTHKGARIVALLDDVRGFTAEPQSGDRRSGRKTGFA